MYHTQWVYMNIDLKHSININMSIILKIDKNKNTVKRAPCPPHCPANRNCGIRSHIHRAWWNCPKSQIPLGQGQRSKTVATDSAKNPGTALLFFYFFNDLKSWKRHSRRGNLIHRQWKLLCAKLSLIILLCVHICS